MIDYNQLIQKLEDENNRVDTSEGQREANAFRIKYIKLINRPKQPNAPYVRLNPVQDRLDDKEYRLTPNGLLEN
ncbi:hypothetical protein HPK19_25735 (plasmid) [Arthrobacter citreus]|nr:hypothetical protein HPK19_25735 [Arthrobacter citreus]